MTNTPPTPENEALLADLYAELDRLNNLKRNLLKEYKIPKPVWDNYVKAIKIRMSFNPNIKPEDFFHPFAPLNYPKITE
ncbi:MAG: hypothetical protein QXT77_04320 [Candidatus Methanomethylicaceae archaeon]